MNERIRKLAERAGYSPLEPRAFADDLQEVFLQKFAELIVRECADVVNYYHSRNESVTPRQILQHFGVEE